jgi:serine/threonine-protein kinase
MMNENNELTFKELQSGTALNAGKYIIEKKIGEGGFGITYKAVQTGLNRAVCIKEYFLAGRCVRNTQAMTVHLQGISDEKYEKYRLAFVKEAQTLASLRHPNIVEVIDIFDENNTSYMVMNFIEGRSLQSIVDANGPLSYPEAVNYMAQITDAVRYIHEHNILHRDIKPENIMVTADYKAILIDFGSAREFEQDKTQMHTTMLTHGYAPPEQYTANSKKGSYTDIYALGATLYFILTGKVPLEAAARLTEELVEPKQLNPSIPDEGNRTIMNAMKLKKEERYQLVQDFMNDLKNVSGGTIRDGNGGNSGFKPKRWVLWGVFAVVLLSGAAIATYKVLHRDTPAIENDDNYLQLFKTTYEDAIKEYDLKVDNIPVDRNGDYGNELLVMDVFFALQKIEQCEKDSLFAELDTNPVFEDKLFLYRKRLNEAKANIQDDIQDDLAHGMSNTHVDRMLKRIELLDNMLEMTKGTSVLDVHPPKPDIQDLN